MKKRPSSKKKSDSQEMKLLPAPQKVPRYPRLFFTSALSGAGVIAQKTFFWVAFSSLVLVNVSLFNPGFKKRITALPAVSRISNLLTRKQRENKNVLGVSQEITNTTIEQARYNDMKQQYAYWRTVVATYPNYRDAYYQLTVLDYQLNDINEAKEYARKVYELDPNFAEGKQLDALLTVPNK